MIQAVGFSNLSLHEPSGCAAARKGRGPPGIGRSRARVAVLHGGAKCKATTDGSCSACHNKDSPLSESRSMHRIVQVACFGTNLSTAKLIGKPCFRTAVHKRAVPAKTSMKVNSRMTRAATLALALSRKARLDAGHTGGSDACQAGCLC